MTTLDDTIRKAKETIFHWLYPSCGRDPGDTRQVYSHWELWQRVSSIAGITDIGITDAALELLTQERDNFNKISDKIYHRARWVKLMNCWGPPPLNEIIDVLRKQDGDKIMEIDAVYANRMGLTTQVPARILYQTDGPSRTEQIGPWKIEFQHADEAITCWAGHPGAGVIQALNWMGQPWVENNRDRVLTRLRKSAWRNDAIPGHVKKDLADNMAQVPEWMRPIIQDVLN